MRRGFSLIEMLIVIMTIPLIGLVVDRAFRDWAIDAPRGVTLVFRHERLQRVVAELYDDIDQATSLSLEDAAQAEGPPVLLIEQAGRQIRYIRMEEGIRRELRGENLDPNMPAEWEWHLAQANIAWKLWRRGDAVVGLHLDTSMTHGRLKKKKFQNSHLVFMGAGLSERQHNATP